jgi:hypothetical protein
VGAAVRMGDAMFGLATVESTLPACEGTAAATLLNMLIVDVCVWYLAVCCGAVEVIRQNWWMWVRWCR